MGAFIIICVDGHNSLLLFKGSSSYGLLTTQFLLASGKCGLFNGAQSWIVTVVMQELYNSTKSLLLTPQT